MTNKIFRHSTLLIILGIFLSCNTTREEKALSKTINYNNFPIEKVAQKPPLGWNSWDVFGTDVTEEEVKAMTDYMAENLKQFGYEYIVIDLAWYAPNATAVGEKYKEPYPEQLIDEYGRLIPVPNRFPSSVNGAGFKPLADYVHSKGLKFGIHVMRGIPRQAVEQNTPIKGTRYRARDIVMWEKTCTFYDGLLSINMDMPGSQEYYNSILELYEEWGVDFIKADDMTSYPVKYDEIMAFRYALEQVDRPMVFSTSPGAANSWDRSFLFHFADMYRISGDFWDNWSSLRNMFNRARIFKGHTGPGGWADCDMIPLGVINIRGEHGDGVRMTRFTEDEQYTLMSFWTIFRSPLMLGMDLTQLDEFTLSLITNEKALDINQNSVNNDEVFHNEDMSIWGAESADGSEKYIAVFNFKENAIRYNLDLKQLLLEMAAITSVYDIWQGKELSLDELKNLNINSHGVRYLVVK